MTGGETSGKANEVQWIAKSARADNAKGIKFPRPSQLHATARAFRDTGKCNFGRIMGLRNPIIQRYLPRPLLVNGRKCDFRVYVYVPSTRPFMAYFHPQFYMPINVLQKNIISRPVWVCVRACVAWQQKRSGAHTPWPEASLLRSAVRRLYFMIL